MSPSDIESILRNNSLSDPPEEVACRAEGDEEILPSVLHKMETVLGEHSTITGVDLLRRRIAAIRDQAGATLETVRLDDAPIRDVQVYRDEDEGKRSRDAQTRCEGMMVVASALAQQLGEQVSADDLRSDPRVMLLTNGWWANNFTVMVPIQRVLQAKAPKTAQRRSDERVFREPAPANELLGRFKELADLGPAGPDAPPKREITIFGQNQIEDDVNSNLLCGTAGTIGQHLKEMASRQPLDPNLGKGNRKKILPSVWKAKTVSSGRGGRRGGQENNRDRELAGLLGEAFVYESFRIALPGFDERAWLSCNRNLYGLEGDGDDSLGFDFSYRDIENRFTGSMNRPRCCMEVKSSSGDGNEPFQISANEWEKARECHESSDSVYIILRVAHVLGQPEITDAIIDPFGLYRAEQLSLNTQSMWVHVIPL